MDDFNTTLTPPPPPERELVSQALTAMIAVDIIGITYLAVLLGLMIWGLVEKRKTLGSVWDNPGTRGCVWLIIIILLQVSFLGVELRMYVQDFHDSPEQYAACQHMARFLPTCWIISKQFTYIYLYERARAVHSSVLSLGQWFIRFCQLVLMFVIFGVAGVFYWGTITKFFGVVYEPEGACVMATNATYLLIMFASLDVVLSAALLFMFLYPLMRHMRNMREFGLNSGFQVKLRYLLKKNILLSTLVTLSALVSLVCMLVLTAAAERDPVGSEHLVILSILAPTLDTVVCITLLMLISDLWRPQFMKSSKSTSNDEDSLKSGGGGAGGKVSKNNNNIKGSKEARTTGGLVANSAIGSGVIVVSTDQQAEI